MFTLIYTLHDIYIYILKYHVTLINIYNCSYFYVFKSKFNLKNICTARKIALKLEVQVSRWISQVSDFQFLKYSY